MNAPVKAISSLELDRLCQQPSAAGDYSPLTGHPLVLLDLLNTNISASANRYEQLGEILSHMPCPTIAIARAGSQTVLTNNVDIVVSSHSKAQQVIKNILQNPLAAMTLVQVLRHNERSGLDDGLLTESLAYAMLQGGKEFKHYLATRAPALRQAGNQQPAVRVERVNDRLTLTLNRPEQYNAYSIAVRDALFEGLQLQAIDSTITKTVIRGAGPCFCTGGALDEFGLTDNIAIAHAIRSSRHVGQLIATLADKVECHLHRACIGSGIELPAFAGHIVAQHNTFFQLPELTMGLIPGAGGTVSILNRIGRQRMAYLALSARRINATTALEWGLIDEIRD